MLAVGANYKGSTKNPWCPVCDIKTEYDSQFHLMLCSKLNNNMLANLTLPNYDDLFSQNMDKKMLVVKTLRENFQKQTKILNQK